MPLFGADATAYRNIAVFFPTHHDKLESVGLDVSRYAGGSGICRTAQLGHTHIRIHIQIHIRIHTYSSVGPSRYSCVKHSAACDTDVPVWGGRK